MLSDIHLGHDVNKAEDMVLNLRKFFKTYDNKIKLLDLIIISGDVFDKLLSNNSPDFHLAYEWLTELLVLCTKYGIILRILEGTNSHDFRQISLLYKTVTNLKLDVDFKYYDILDIEINKELGISILYLPDEWKHDTKDIYKDVLRKLKEHDLDKVDFIVMHGAFSYQMPEFLSHNTHDPEAYSKLAHGPVIAGHVHIRSKYRNVIIPGSFERLSHSDDDEKKGGLLIDYDTVSHKWDFKYLDNTHALEFFTFDVRDYTIEEVKKKLDKHKSNKVVHIRLLVGDNSKLKDAFLDLKRLYPNIVFSVKKEKKDNDNKLERHAIVKTINKLDRNYLLGRIKEAVGPSRYSAYLDEFEIIEKLK